ncbi:alpha/beta hydrolase [Pectobacteriaceae bacterium CE70]|nr:alpha/beta hydrolase [Pectobacteriaceae bacterium C52]WJV65368.1 alpha/beta hydrolase [Pectobacteriaceae bacterium CE70]WJY09384.1 alpha/beta hydrolase [Pectobacteriaceae bacterium C80]
MAIEKSIVNYKSWNVYVEKHISNPGNETVIMVNGALSTTSAFKNTVKNLSGKYNIILFDLPFIGESMEHNDLNQIVTKNDEVGILLHLIEIYAPQYIISISWGGLSSLLALSKKPEQIKKAVIASFSAHLNDRMLDYVERARSCIHARRYEDAAMLLNNEVGKFLPPLLKHINLKHLSTMGDFAYQQAVFHIDQVLTLKEENYIDIFKNINAEVLFLNGEDDEYTTAEDIQRMGCYISNCQFSTVPDAGHFLDLENRKAAKKVAQAIISFLA